MLRHPAGASAARARRPADAARLTTSVYTRIWATEELEIRAGTGEIGHLAYKPRRERGPGFGYFNNP